MNPSICHLPTVSLFIQGTCEAMTRRASRTGAQSPRPFHGQQAVPGTWRKAQQLPATFKVTQMVPDKAEWVWWLSVQTRLGGQRG